VLALQNDGYLALVAPTYLPFAEMVMETICRTFDEVKFDVYGNETFGKAKEIIRKHEKSFVEAFLKCSNGDHGMAEARVTEAVRFLVEKSCNAYIGALTKWYKEKSTGKGGTAYVAGTFRGHLRYVTSGLKRANSRPGKRELNKRLKSKDST